MPRVGKQEEFGKPSEECHVLVRKPALTGSLLTKTLFKCCSDVALLTSNQRYLVAMLLEKFYFLLRKGCHGDGLHSVGRVQTSPK